MALTRVRCFAAATPRRVVAASVAPRPQPVRVVVVRAASTQTSEAYAAQLHKAEESGDWLRAFEIMTEANALKMALPSPAVEGAIRTMAKGGQAARAMDLLSKMQGHTPSEATVSALFAAFAAGKHADLARALLQELEKGGASPRLRSLAHNATIKTLARAGQAVAAYEALDVLVTNKQGLVVELDTYSSVCIELMKVGETEKAEEVLEWREFLHSDD
uniref:PROP1-like PPR domain-containing protein n=1 Tax=Chlamydomonas leiostraca TaxID=1034604 RepID=A0A7S0WM12_9CHLO|mmetsp:Transcript_18494/g.46851  ORF Transcript_18494/g.46851 Transcript_18494/m.46851 type:complete len:218 (+) Transcript_18494:98-751(+)|eukprot:CAMPEP_0202862990 /NCGR_PEP_ID=MMETSP1391-20130828/3815_1 /ASSEMBLY_ACC=CAM_ASM_000867 /TAXON_ID=1034604 /ORGANISM="Chlamydomonas leiostraca, Strain SAG 11-49" /LENGTH=217 /DNA_ID=CAMNT_0049542585 /DNA_START=79 /DNA_END=732 /DNA_ORIENTATION=-